MNQFHNAMEMLDLIMPPAFCVHNGRIIKVNSAAAALMIEADTDIHPLLQTCADEYAAFQSGCLYLTLTVGNQKNSNVDYVLFDGAIYTCIAPDGTVCVWSPLEYPQYWAKTK